VVSKLIGSSAVTDRHMCAAARRVVTVWARRAMQAATGSVKHPVTSRFRAADGGERRPPYARKEPEFECRRLGS
jgi:hypothetical protein